jgi:hypothetical protein
MDNDGWIKLHRKIQKWEWADDPYTLATWIHCLLAANHEERRWHGIIIPKGSFVTSYTKLAKIVGISTKSVRTALEHLKQTRELASKSTSKYTLISITNWDSYQTTGTPAGRQTASKGQTTGNKQEVKKLRREEREHKSIEEIGIEDFQEISKTLGVRESFVSSKWESFKDYCISNGKEYKDYRAALRNAVRKDMMPGDMIAKSGTQLTEGEKRAKGLVL